MCSIDSKLFIIAVTVCNVLHTSGFRVTFSVNADSGDIESYGGFVNGKYDTSGESSWVVSGYYKDSYTKIGWGVLELDVNPAINRAVSAYMVGYAEGVMTKQRIDQQWNNTIGDYCQGSKRTSKSCSKLNSFLQTNFDWMSAMIKKNQGDSYWDEVNLILLQLQGLLDGHDGKAKMDLTLRIDPLGLFLLQLAGDLAEIETALNVTERLHEDVVGSGSCSGFIKLVHEPNGEFELYTSHDSWTAYNMMLRLMKRINFPDHTEVFSGYPGMLFSGDDFYILSSGLATMETTNGNYNSKLWQFVTPQSVLEWTRTLIANRHAKNGEDWCKIFEKYNSGTYNNQWMITDFNKFASKSVTGILHVLEQIPGKVVYSDLTDILFIQSYWASYNIPYFHTIFEESGVPNLVKQYGDYFTHDGNPRAKIFARDHEKVTDMDSLIKLMRYNDFKHDELSRCNCTPPYSAANAIAARCELNDPNGVYPIPTLKQRNHGATDMKATSSSLARDFTIVAECGPTHDQQPIFAWSKSPYANSPHEGHVDIFDFKPETFKWGKK